MLGKFGARVQARRLAKRELYGGAKFDQRPLGERIGGSQTIISDIENDRPSSFMQPEIANALAAELADENTDAAGLLAEWLIAAGYKINAKLNDNSLLMLILEQLTLSDFIRLKYGIQNTDFAPGLERVIRNAAETERGSGKL